MLACAGAHQDTIEYLLQHDQGTIKEAGYPGCPLLHWCCFNDYTEAVRFLLGPAGQPYGITDHMERLAQPTAGTPAGDHDRWNGEGTTALCAAVAGGHLDLVKLLIEAGADVGHVRGATPSERMDALAWAVLLDQAAVVAFLLGQAAIKEDMQGATMLSLFSSAVEFGHSDVIRVLLRHLAAHTAEVRETLPGHLLHKACQHHYRAAALKALLEHGGFDVNGRHEGEGETALMTAAARQQCGQGCTLALRCLLKTPAIDVNAKDRRGRTVLHYALRYEHACALRTLLRHGVVLDPHAVFTATEAGQPSAHAVPDGATYLHVAAQGGNRLGVKKLLKLGTDVNAVDARGRTPLMLACANRQTMVVRLLLAARADVHLADKDGYTGMNHTVMACSENILHLLLDRGAVLDVNQRTAGGNTLLHDCINHLTPGLPPRRRLDSKVLWHLIRSGADPNARNHDGVTPLMLAVDRGIDTAIVYLLVRPDIDLNERCYPGGPDSAVADPGVAAFGTIPCAGGRSDEHEHRLERD